MESLHVIFDARWDHERTGQHRTTSKYHSCVFDVGCWMFTWALNVECRMLNVDEHSTLNIQRSTPKTPRARFMESSPGREMHEGFKFRIGNDEAPRLLPEKNKRTPGVLGAVFLCGRPTGCIMMLDDA